MGNKFGIDILIQAPDPKTAAAFYVKALGFEITGESSNLISIIRKLRGVEGAARPHRHLEIFADPGPNAKPLPSVGHISSTSVSWRQIQFALRVPSKVCPEDSF